MYMYIDIHIKYVYVYLCVLEYAAFLTSESPLKELCLAIHLYSDHTTHGEKRNISEISRHPIQFSPVWYTQRNIFGILLNRSQIRLYLPCTD